MHKLEKWEAAQQGESKPVASGSAQAVASSSKEVNSGAKRAAEVSPAEKSKRVAVEPVARQAATAVSPSILPLDWAQYLLKTPSSLTNAQDAHTEAQAALITSLRQLTAHLNNLNSSTPLNLSGINETAIAIGSVVHSLKVLS
jgi:hypothetical protein